MQLVRPLSAAVALVLVLSLSAAAAEEGFFSRLNPFSSGKSASPSQNKPFPGFSNHSSKRKPEKSVLGKTVDSVSNTTKTAWNKTTTALSPSRFFSSGSSNKSNKKAPTRASQSKSSSSSWSLFHSAEETPKETKTVNDWLSQPRINP